MFEWGNYNVTIYGDGKYEYKGMFMVVIDEFDDNDKPTMKMKVLYFVAPNKKVLAETIKYNINKCWNSRNYSKHIVNAVYKMS